MAKTVQEAVQNLYQRLNSPDGLSDAQVRNDQQVFKEYPCAEYKYPPKKPRKPVDFMEIFRKEVDNQCPGFVIKPEIACIVRYFLRKEEFKRGPISNTPDLEKGLFVHGPYGTGKSMIFSIMHAIGKRLYLEHGYKGMWFTAVTAPWIVDSYIESRDRNYTGHFDFNSYRHGPLYIDDLGMEKLAYGRDDIIADLLFERHANMAKTYISSNLNESEFLDRYGPRLGDRMHESFNIIEFTGKSYRE